MDKNVEIPMLLDIYGGALPMVQRDSLDMYYNSDLSLGEIADNTGKSRQSVFDTIRRGEHALQEMEENLKILEKNRILQNKIDSIRSLLMEVKKCISDDKSKELVDSALNELKDLKL